MQNEKKLKVPLRCFKLKAQFFLNLSFQNFRIARIFPVRLLYPPEGATLRWDSSISHGCRTYWRT